MAENPNADPGDGTTSKTTELQKQATIEIAVNLRAEIEEGGDVAEDMEAPKHHALQLRMPRLAGWLYPDEGALVFDLFDVSNIHTLEAELPGDRRCDRTYKPLPNRASDSDSEASIFSINFDEAGEEVVAGKEVSVGL